MVTYDWFNKIQIENKENGIQNAKVHFHTKTNWSQPWNLFPPQNMFNKNKYVKYFYVASKYVNVLLNIILFFHIHEYKNAWRTKLFPCKLWVGSLEKKRVGYYN